ncbi:MAG: WD40 repeat domain-containing protein [Planctomycetota bacterium]
MPYRLSRRSWIASGSTAVFSFAVSRPSFAETAALWSSSSTILCKTTSFRDRVGVGVVLTAMTGTPDGQYLAAAGDDHQIRIIRTSDLNTVHSLAGHRDRIRRLAFSRDGRHLASVANDGQVFVFDSQSDYRKTHHFAGKVAVAGAAFAPNDFRLAVVDFSGRVHVIDLNTQKLLRIESGIRDLRAVAYRDDGGMLAIGGQGGSLILLDPRDGQQIDQPSLHRGRIHSLSFHRDANVVTTIGDDGTAVVYDTERRERLKQIPVTTGKLFSIAVLNSQSVAVAGSDNRIRILNTDDGSIVRSLDGHVGSVASLTKVGESLFSAGFDATLRRWSIDASGTQTERIAESDPTKDR